MQLSPSSILQTLHLDAFNAMQEEMIARSRRATDIVLLSPTGSGKTLAYLIPLISHIDETSPTVQAVVITPSRELALQTHEVIRSLRLPLRSMAVYGGRPAMEEHQQMRGLEPHIIIGTPGRLLDHLTKQNFASATVRQLVIDEFDKSLELGFHDEMRRVIELLPAIERRVLLSATPSDQIPEFVPTATAQTLDFSAPPDDALSIYTVHSPTKDKLETLRQLLLSLGQTQSLVFAGYRESVERVARYLTHEGFYVSAYHGGMEQQRRERALYQFAGGATTVMVSTDLASRGLDLPRLDNVIHYHLPPDAQTFTHRNGRTARWDRTGRAFLILGPEEVEAPQAPQGGMWQTWVPPTSPLGGLGGLLPLWVTLYIGKGRRDKLSRGDIAGFLMKVGGLQSDEVGRIDVRDHYTYVSIARARLDDVLRRTRGQKIKGIKTIIEPTR